MHSTLESPTINEMSTRQRHIRRWLPVIAITAAWAGLHAFLIFIGDSLDGDLLSTDPYMRLVRVTELVDGGGWFNSVIDRSNAPFGDDLHWTRPFDVLLLLIAAPLTPFIGFEDALFTAGVTVSPLLHLVMIFAASWAAAPLIGSRAARLTAVFVLLQPTVVLQALPGQADHHALQLLVLVIEAGLLFRLLRPQRPFDPRRLAIAAGAVGGFGIWVSAETTILVGLVSVALGVLWLRDAIPARMLRHYALGLAAVVTVAILVERAPTAWLSVEYDKVSLAQLAIAAAVLAVASAFEWIETHRPQPRARLVLALAWVGIVGVALLLAFPGLIVGPTFGIDSRLGPIWLDHITELQPLFPTDRTSFARFLFRVGPAVIALPYVVVVAWRARRDPTWSAWTTVAILFVGYFGLALWHIRFAPSAGVLLAIVSAEIVFRMHDWTELLPMARLRRAAWVVSAPLFIVGFQLAGIILIASTIDQQNEGITADQCDLHAAAAAINSQPDAADAVVFAHIDYGPELLYRTDAAVVAGPYHRNGSGILNAYDFFSGTDLDQSRRLAEARETRFVLVCDTGSEAGFFGASRAGESLYERLVDDDPPPWLSLAARGTEEQRFRLYEFRSDR